MGKEGNSTVSVYDALRIIISRVRPLEGERVPLLEAAGRHLYNDIVAAENIPFADNSAMDGYALRSADTHGADKKSPVKLQITGEIKTGPVQMEHRLETATALRIMTGAPVPAGADAVVQFEDTAEAGNTVLIYREVKTGENVRRAGEDIAAGSVVLRKGDRINSAEVGLLASLNMRDVHVSRRPEVALLSTGDEVVEVGAPMRPGQLRNSNAYTLYAEIKKYGGVPRIAGIAGDTKEETVDMLGSVSSSDVIVTTGGVSKGRYDFVKDALREAGIEILVENVRMRPGKPFVFGVCGAKLFFGLPGNPVSAMVSFMQFVRPALLYLSGAGRTSKPIVRAILKEDIEKKPGLTYFLRGFYSTRDGVVFVSTTGPQGSGILRSMSAANCLIVLPEHVEKIRAGEGAEIQLIHHEEI
jgi:molybdopterin molybdotransferase